MVESTLRTGSLTIVGLGPARPEHVTLEAFQCLSRAQGSSTRAYGLHHVRRLAEQLTPGLIVRPLEPFYQNGLARSEVYRRIADMLVSQSFEEGLDVLYLVAGSPLFINDAVLLVRRHCEAAGQPIRIVHGLSFLDLVLGGVHWTGHAGLQLYSAWNVARDGVRPSPEAPLLLFQLGEFSEGVDALDATGSTRMLEEVRDALMPVYGAEHEGVVLYSSGDPEYRAGAHPVTLGALAEEPVPIYSNLWVPARVGAPAEHRAPPSPGPLHSGV